MFWLKIFVLSTKTWLEMAQILSRTPGFVTGWATFLSIQHHPLHLLM